MSHEPTTPPSGQITQIANAIDKLVIEDQGFIVIVVSKDDPGMRTDMASNITTESVLSVLSTALKELSS